MAINDSDYLHDNASVITPYFILLFNVKLEGQQNDIVI